MLIDIRNNNIKLSARFKNKKHILKIMKHILYVSTSIDTEKYGSMFELSPDYEVCIAKTLDEIMHEDIKAYDAVVIDTELSYKGNKSIKASQLLVALLRLPEENNGLAFPGGIVLFTLADRITIEDCFQKFNIVDWDQGVSSLADIVYQQKNHDYSGLRNSMEVAADFRHIETRTTTSPRYIGNYGIN
jgi:hypothetical protein